MPFPIAHSLTGLMVASCSDRFPTKKIYYEVLLVALLANLPDFDFAAVFLTDNLFWHRAFSHSLTMALIVGALTCLWYFGKLERERWIIYSGVVFSHPILDMITTPINSHMGVMLFWPFSDHRYGAGLIHYPFKDWASNHGLDLILFFAKVSIFELLVYLPILMLIIAIKRRWFTRVVDYPITNTK
jgi:membrane-bound metal-dependent hydrolase YbcI (DUF457 family)